MFIVATNIVLKVKIKHTSLFDIYANKFIFIQTSVKYDQTDINFWLDDNFKIKGCYNIHALKSLCTLGSWGAKLNEQKINKETYVSFLNVKRKKIISRQRKSIVKTMKFNLLSWICKNNNPKLVFGKWAVFDSPLHFCFILWKNTPSTEKWKIVLDKDVNVSAIMTEELIFRTKYVLWSK